MLQRYRLQRSNGTKTEIIVTTFDISAAKARFSELIRRAEAGEEIVVARGNRPVVRFVPYVSKVRPSKGFGSMKGLVEVGPEFFEPLPEEDLEAWYR